VRKLLLDLPASRPALGFDDTAEALARIVEYSDPRFAVGIFGGWGSGKTTLMQAIRARLAPDRLVAVGFVAWRYEKEEHLIVPLLDTVREALLEWSANRPVEKPRASRTAAAVGRVMRSIIAGTSMTIGVPGAIDLTFDANKALAAQAADGEQDEAASVPGSFYHASFCALRAAFHEFVGPDPDTARRIVVFVDDLDRCLPESALQVLESMKLFLDLPGFVFVVGLDQEVVEHVIDAKYGRPPNEPHVDPARG
jgi:predicted KAP-like P-loop ATPase